MTLAQRRHTRAFGSARCTGRQMATEAGRQARIVLVRVLHEQHVCAGLAGLGCTQSRMG
jgi:hypothetical protein